MLGHNFLACLFPLSLFLFRLHAVSMGSAGDIWWVLDVLLGVNLLRVDRLGVGDGAGSRVFLFRGCNDNEGVLRIPQSSSITGTSLSDCLVSYPGLLWGGLPPLQRCSRCILQPQLTGQPSFEVSRRQMFAGDLGSCF